MLNYQKFKNNIKAQIMKNLRIKIAVITVSIVFAVLQWLVPPLFIQKVSVSMELKTWNDEVCQIFYGTRINSFADNQPVTMQYSSRGDFIKIYIPVTNRMKINNLRIDPVTNSKEFHIKNIILYVGKNEIVYSGEEKTSARELPLSVEIVNVPVCPSRSY